jgi:proline-specific peptidase
MATMSVRGISLFVKVIGHGHPLALMHGGPGADHHSMLSLRPCADQLTLVFYDHRCNGRSEGAEISSMTWDNLTADAEALRHVLGFEKWAVLGHSFGGMVALEYALRYPQSLSHLLLLDTCGDTWWVRQNAPEILAKRGFRRATVETAQRYYTGQIELDDYLPSFLKLARAFYHRPSPRVLARDMAVGLRMKSRPEAYLFAARELLKGWTVMDRLGEIQVPTLVLAGRDDFQFPPEHQAQLAAGIPNAHLEIIERAGHNAPTERPEQVIQAVREFMAAATPSGA